MNLLNETTISIGICILAMLIIIFSAHSIGSDKVLRWLFFDDIARWTMQRKEWHKRNYIYIAIFFVVFFYPITLWHTVAISFVPNIKSVLQIKQLWFFEIIPAPLLIASNRLPATISIFFLWYVISLLAINIVSSVYFQHSQKAKRIAQALIAQTEFDQRLRPFAENIQARIQVAQIDHDWVIISHDLPITSLWFRQKKNEIAASAQLKIIEQKEIAEWVFGYKCEFYSPNIYDKLDSNRWVENYNFTYFIAYEGKGGRVCKIGTSNNVESRLRTYRTSNPDAEIELKIPEIELTENDAHDLFAESRIDGEVFKWEGQVEQFVEQRKVQL